jgi:hypothetical protein
MMSSLFPPGLIRGACVLCWVRASVCVERERKSEWCSKVRSVVGADQSASRAVGLGWLCVCGAREGAGGDISETPRALWHTRLGWLPGWAVSRLCFFASGAKFHGSNQLREMKAGAKLKPGGKKKRGKREQEREKREGAADQKEMS